MIGVIDGRILEADHVLKSVSLWKDPKGMVPRGKSIKHGKRIRILKDHGSYILIRRFFKKGFVYSGYVREVV